MLPYDLIRWCLLSMARSGLCQIRSVALNVFVFNDSKSSPPFQIDMGDTISKLTMMLKLSAYYIMCILVIPCLSGVVPQDKDPNTKLLSLSKEPIPLNHSTSFVRYTNLGTLYMIKCSLVYVKDGTFDLLGKLEHINFQDYKIIEFPVSFGLASGSLTELQFWAAFDRDSIPTLNFRSCSKLAELILGYNDITSLDPSTLPPNLMTINQNYQAGFSIFPNITGWTPKLNIIGLNGNDIQHTPAENIRNVNVTELHLESNDLTSIPEYTAYPNITTLRVRNNQLTTLPDFFNTTLKQLQISQNPLRCDQALCWIRMSPWVFDTTILMDAPTCASPTAEDGKLLMDVNPVTMECYRGRQMPFYYTETKLIQYLSHQLIWRRNPREK